MPFANPPAGKISLVISVAGATTIILPSGDTSGVTDTANIQAALNGAAPGGVVILAATGTFYIKAPLVIPAGVGLLSPSAAFGNPVANFGAGPLPLGRTIVQAVPAFSGAAMISIASSGSQNGGQYLAGLALDGSQISGANTVDGILLNGAVAQVTIRDCVVYGGASFQLGGSGLHCINNADGNPDALKIYSSQFQKCGTHGVDLQAGVADSFWESVSCTACQSDAWRIINGNSSRYVGCKGETSGGFGFNIQGATGFTGFAQFTSCSTEGNTSGGFSLSGTGTGTWYLGFCHANEAVPWTYSGTNNVRTPAAYNASTAAPTLN